jgi:Cu/Ag efflux protein CusF
MIGKQHTELHHVSVHQNTMFFGEMKMKKIKIGDRLEYKEEKINCRMIHLNPRCKETSRDSRV